MNDKLKNFFEKERAEIEKHKLRIGAVFFCLIFLIIFVSADFEESEEINLAEVQPVEENIPADKKAVEQKISEKKSEVAKVENKNVTAVKGANSEILFVRDPFKISVEEDEVEDKKVEAEKKSDSPKVEEKFSQPVIIQQPASQKNLPPQPATLKSAENFILTGTAIGDNQKTALIQHYKDDKLAETLMLSVGDTLNGKKIIEITEDFLQLDGGEKIYLSLQ